jgi:nitroimidazol reductase NimA-like FMN-containing flavoprotein (pyridoxamine 5'-phosphate oxidase superfamily)
MPGAQQQPATAITVAEFLDVADGLQPGQFSVGRRGSVSKLAELEPIYRQLMDEPVTAVVAVTGGDGRPNLTPMWFDFDYERNLVLINVAQQRRKTEWIRKHPRLTVLLMNPKNPYHWMSLKIRVANEIHEDDPTEGGRVTAQLDRIWTKYTNNPPPYGLRDPAINERRVLFECQVERLATFGKP